MLEMKVNYEIHFLFNIVCNLYYTVMDSYSSFVKSNIKDKLDLYNLREGQRGSVNTIITKISNSKQTSIIDPHFKQLFERSHSGILGITLFCSKESGLGFPWITICGFLSEITIFAYMVILYYLLISVENHDPELLHPCEF